MSEKSIEISLRPEAEGQVDRVAALTWIPMDVSDFVTRHNYGLGIHSLSRMGADETLSYS